MHHFSALATRSGNFVLGEDNSIYTSTYMYMKPSLFLYVV